MATDVASNPPASITDSKSGRKKKAKASAESGSASAATPTTRIDPSQADIEKNGEGSHENSFVRELQKNIRNVTKKLNGMAKVDSVISENPNLSLDDLVATRKINNDQKAQALKKPQLQAQLAQYEEQLTHFKKFEQEYEQKLATEKDRFQSSHKEELEALTQTLKSEAEAELKQSLKQRYLILSQFLRAAASKRQQEGPETDERQAFEGVLLLVYGGDATAVDAIEKIVEGSEDVVNSVEGTPTGVTYSQIQKSSLEEANPFANEEAWVDNVAQAQAAAGSEEDVTAVATDPTVAHAGLTELNTKPTGLNGSASNTQTPNAPASANIDAGAANAAAEEQWDRTVSASEDPLAESFEMVPRDPAETETPAAPAPITSVQSWAEDTPVEPPTTKAQADPATPAANGDGFHEVHHNRGGRGRGSYPDRGPFRGRGGPRGDGRGRGGYRGRGERGRSGGFRGGRGNRDAPNQ